MKTILTFSILFITTLNCNIFAQTRLKELTHIAQYEDVKLSGYGLVIGLDGTGDSRSSNFTISSVANMLSKFGIEIDPKKLRTKNVAAVMVTTKISPFSKPGSNIDVTVSSIGDAKSLKGGTLLATPLTLNGEKVFGVAQGPIFVGGYDYNTRDFGYLRHNHTLTARIPNGATITKTISNPFYAVKDSILLYLNQPDFTNAISITNAINNYFNKKIAQAYDPATVIIKIPDSLNNHFGITSLIAQFEQISVNTDIKNKIIINERTGTVVAGQNIKIKPVAIAHDNIDITIGTPQIEPRKMINVAKGDINITPQVASGMNTIITDSLMVNVSGGNLTVNPTNFASIPDSLAKSNKTVVLPATTTIQDLASALNSLGVEPRDLITIFQLLKNAGAINGELEIM